MQYSVQQGDCIDSIAAALIEGETDDDGRLEVSIPPGAREAFLRVEPGTERETVIPLELGGLDPLHTIPGAKARLAHLGYECGNRDEAEGDAFSAALEVFQRAQDLEPSGTLDDDTRDALEQAHGS